jgi:hypothetical protein
MTRPPTEGGNVPHLPLSDPLRWLVLALCAGVLAVTLWPSTGRAAKRHPCRALKSQGAAFWRCETRFHARWVRRLQVERRRERGWGGDVHHALRLASSVFRVPYRELASVAACESNLYPFAVNGRFKGLFQLGWSPFGLSPFDPYASALSAAMTVRQDGSWRQWSCKP